MRRDSRAVLRTSDTTAPAGFAAAGIKPARLPPVEAAQPKAELLYAPQHQEHGYDQTLGTGEWTELPRGSGRNSPPRIKTCGPHTGPGPIEVRPHAPALPDVDYMAAVLGFVHQHGIFQNARQFRLFLGEHGIVDPATGGPILEPLLRPVLQKVRIEDPSLWTTGTPKRWTVRSPERRTPRTRTTPSTARTCPAGQETGPASETADSGVGIPGAVTGPTPSLREDLTTALAGLTHE
ncbi:hypothetical protein [Streptomyces sp. TE33382]